MLNLPCFWAVFLLSENAAVGSRIRVQDNQSSNICRFEMVEKLWVMTTYISPVCGCWMPQLKGFVHGCGFSVSHRDQFGLLIVLAGDKQDICHRASHGQWPSWCCWCSPAPGGCSGFLFPLQLWAPLGVWAPAGAPASLSSWLWVGFWQSWQLIVHKSEFFLCSLSQSSLCSRILPLCAGRQKSFIMEYLIFQMAAATGSVNSLCGLNSAAESELSY